MSKKLNLLLAKTIEHLNHLIFHYDDPIAASHYIKNMFLPRVLTIHQEDVPAPLREFCLKLKQFLDQAKKLEDDRKALGPLTMDPLEKMRQELAEHKESLPVLQAAHDFVMNSVPAELPLPIAFAILETLNFEIGDMRSCAANIALHLLNPTDYPIGKGGESEAEDADEEE